MTSSTRLALTALAFAVFGFMDATASQGPQARGQRMYDPATETTVTGTVAAVEEVTNPQSRRGMGGVHLTLKTASESLVVHLGPIAYLQEQKLTVGEGDGLEIVGSRITIDGAPVLLARTVKKGTQTWTLRDATGKPRWSGPPSR